MTTRVICCYTKLPAQVKKALNASGYSWEAIDVSDSDQAYFEVIQDLWNYGQGFALVEHDIVVGPETLKSFEDCSEPWCASPYPYFAGSYAGLGCVRFRTELIGQSKGLMEEIANISNPLHPPGHYCTLDSWIQRGLYRRGFSIHRHEPVGHLHRWPTHGCVKEPVCAPQ